MNEVLNKILNVFEDEKKRIERMLENNESKDFDSLERIVVGIAPGDGIGPIIMKEAVRVLQNVLAEEIETGKVELRDIEGLTIENRVKHLKSIPDDVLEEIRKCDVILKGPTTTPSANDDLPNLQSANASLRRELDLFANVRPVKIEEENIDWMFFRENIEGAYILGSKGVQVDENLAVDFVVETRPGSERIARLAFEYAKKNRKKNVTVVTKSNIVKLTDGNFIKAVRRVGEEYPDINIVEKLVDATAAKMGDSEFVEGLEVFVLPNLYGDIITDIGAEMQGGLGTVGSANIGSRYAVFEAIHGTAPFLMNNGRGDYANPCSLFRAICLMLNHIGMVDKSKVLEDALDITTKTEKKLVVTTFKEDASAKEFTDYLLDTLDNMVRTA